MDDIDGFFFDKIKKKLVYWESMRLWLVGRRIIVNLVVASMLGYFITLWSNSLKVIWKIRATLRNFL